LLIYLVANIFRSSTLMTTKLVYVAALVLTLAQVLLGFVLLASPSAGLLMAHQGLAVLILVLMAVGGMVAARSRRMPMGTST